MANDDVHLAWSNRGFYAGFDWSYDCHQVVVVDHLGRKVEQFSFEHTAEGWKKFRDLIAKYPDLAVAVETRTGAVVDRLLDCGAAVYPVSPKAAERFRERKAPSGGKTDPLDAWSMADALRVDGHGWKQLMPDDPLTQQLRIVCRDEIALIEQRTAFVLQLKQALYEYYPAALEAFDDWTLTGAWEFVIKFSTPESLAKARRTGWDRFLKRHQLMHAATYERRMEAFARTQPAAPAAVVEAKSLLAVALAKQLLLLDEQLDGYRTHIRKLFAQHPDHEIFGSLPGAGGKLGPRLLAEFGADRNRFDNAQSVQCYVGTAPVSFNSGKQRKARFRLACNRTFRATVHLWSNLSRADCAWAEIYYQTKRSQGQSHACALRCLGQRWLKILWKMWQTKTCYDEALHTKNQTEHGSWVLGLLPPKTAATV